MQDIFTEDEFEYVYRNIIAIPHIFLTRAHERFDKLRAVRRRIISGHAFKAESRGTCLFAPRQSGKSSIVRIYIQQNVVDYCYRIGLFPPETPRHIVAEEQRKVIHITVSGTSTLMSLLEDILRAYGDPNPEKGKTLGKKKERILKYIKDFGTELLIFDEMQHLLVGSSGHLGSEAGRVHNTLKGFLLDGVPVVFVGTEEAEKKVFSDGQISARCPKRLWIGKLNWKKLEHRKCFHDYCGLVGLELQRHGLMPKRSNFIGRPTVACLFVASNGYLGHASNIIANAVEYALEQGAQSVRWEHLSTASDEYTIGEGLATYNPFKRWVAKHGVQGRKAA
ncbi:AAA domain-containing protein [Rhizobium gallicum bv. gallicum R602sp]|uniref:AAA domain-containing protein n=1 Tax=Rhizobium gallicum bv. gallicum R602sp TaxID=1041138 RepID=A0A0B4X153_9HYPH|nr:ATP-binding protein [Rhizobium gallicum]AJD41669.1 AAA domain-containing protein [Rhizobium gallicum bv. gallicum R602sp]